MLMLAKKYEIKVDKITELLSHVLSPGNYAFSQKREVHYMTVKLLFG